MGMDFFIILNDQNQFNETLVMLLGVGWVQELRRIEAKKKKKTLCDRNFKKLS